MRIFINLCIRLFKSRKYWHNRIYLREKYSVEKTKTHINIKYKKKYLRANYIERLKVNIKEANILLSGPSVHKISNPQKLFERFLVVVNGSHEFMSCELKKIDAYIISDPGFVKRKFEIFKNGVEKSQCIILDHSSILAALMQDENVFDNIDTYIIDDLIRPFLKNKDFELATKNNEIIEKHGVRLSTNPEIGFYSNSSVIFTAIQVLYWLKFKQIYIFGLDLKSNGRSYKEKNPEKSSLESSYSRKIEPTFKLIKDCLITNGFNITNCSLDSRLPNSIIPKLSPDKCLK